MAVGFGRFDVSSLRSDIGRAGVAGILDDTFGMIILGKFVSAEVLPRLFVGGAIGKDVVGVILPVGGLIVGGCLFRSLRLSLTLR